MTGILEPKLGYQSGYIVVIDGSDLYKDLLYKSMNEGCDTTICGLHLIELMEDSLKLACGTCVLYGDTDEIHVRIDSNNLDEAIRVGKNVANIINENIRCHLTMGFPNVKLRAISDMAYYIAKKKFIMKIVWLNGYILNQPTYTIIGARSKNKDIMDTLIRNDNFYVGVMTI
jgi:hypothetical protein